MKIGQVSRKYSISKDNIYYYINYGLLVPPKLNNQYVFDDETIGDLEWILELKDMEYSLSDIHRMISLRRISNLDNPKDKGELKDMYAAKRAECVEKVKHYESVIADLDERIMDLSKREPAVQKHTGLPLSMLGLLCCPLCGKPLEIKDVNMDMTYIYDGKFTCSCGYHAEVDDGILITPNGYDLDDDKPDINREFYKDLPPSLISLFQRSYNYMKDELSKMDLAGKVVMETYVNAWFFLHNHQQCVSPKGYYIIVDKYPETLRMYKNLIEQENYDLSILYIADSSTNFPIKKDCVDLNIDYFAVNEHNFYHDTFLLNELRPYFKDDTTVLGTYFYFENGIKSMKELLDTYPSCSANNFSLRYFMGQIPLAGYGLDGHKVCGYTTDSGNNLSFSFHHKGEKMFLMSYVGHVEKGGKHGKEGNNMRSV